MTERIDYSHHWTKQEAEAAIEDYFATGEIDVTDDPRIVIAHKYAGKCTQYVVTLSAKGRW